MIKKIKQMIDESDFSILSFIEPKFLADYLPSKSQKVMLKMTILKK